MKSLVVSVHDVSPSTSTAVCRILEDLEGLGITRTSLLVIPNHHQQGHFLADPEFCEWLVEMAVKGHEIVAHGYFHRRERTARESVLTKMTTRFYTADEGEFYDLTETAALEKMRLALSEFALLDLHPTGFIAPVWLLSAAARRAAKIAGFRYTTTLREICDLTQDNASHLSQSLVFSVRSAWRRFLSIGWNRFLLSWLEKNPIVRLSIHPADWQHPAIRHEILLLANYLVNRRKATTYGKWIAA